MASPSPAVPIFDPSTQPRSRLNSTQDSSPPSTGQALGVARPNSPNLSSPKGLSPQYRVFIRLPFQRAEFGDPAPVKWDTSKDRKLWKLISGSQANLDWEGLSQDFGVDLGFLLRVAAWLSERHMDRIRKQVGKIAGAGQLDGTVSTPGSGNGSAVGGLGLDKGASRDPKLPKICTTVAPRRPSLSAGDSVGSSGATAPQARAPISRTPSSVTVTQSKITGSPRQLPQLQRAFRGSSGSGRRLTPATFISSAANSPRDEYHEDVIEHEGPSGSDSEDEPSAMARSQALRGPPLGRKHKSNLVTLGSEGDGEGGDEDDDSGSGGYLPFAASTKPEKADQTATLRDTFRPTSPSTNWPLSTPHEPHPSRENSGITTSESSNSSAAMHHQVSSDTDQVRAGNRRRPVSALSPRQRAQLASMSPRSRREGSEDSPSMGSSFSDLDDASVTQSALEDALMSNMRQAGGSVVSMASRIGMGSLRDALGRRGQGQ